MAALIDPSSIGGAVLPFIGGFVVGAFAGPVLEGVLAGMLGGIGADDGSPDAGVAYAYHGRHGKHGQGMHSLHRPAFYNKMKSRPTRNDFEKGYQNIEQTYSNHIFINDRKSSV